MDSYSDLTVEDTASDAPSGSSDPDDLGSLGPALDADVLADASEVLFLMFERSTSESIVGSIQSDQSILKLNERLVIISVLLCRYFICSFVAYHSKQTDCRTVTNHRLI